jgi:hyperosmotically inducible protein
MFSYTRTTLRLLAPASLALLAFSLASAPALSQMQVSPDNSRTNTVQNQDKTADQQTNGKSDVQLTAQIRRNIVADKSLSTYGHNVKIIVANGAVTLKGPVHSDDEKQTIAAKAADVVGKDKVDNQLTVKQ